MSNDASTIPPMADPSSRFGKSFSIGSLLNVPIRVHFSYFLVLLIVVLSSISFLSAKYTIYQMLLYGPILFGTVLIHEFGHVLAAKHLGGAPVGIVVWPLGGLGISTPPDPPSHRSNMIVAAAGPATHLIGAIWLGLANLTALASSNHYNCTINYYYLLHGSAADWFAYLFLGAFYLNLSLLLFNLLIPAYPLDGGQIFASILLMRGVPPETAGRITAVTAIVISSILFIIGVVTLFTGQNPFSVLNILVAMWILHSSYELYKLVGDDRVTEHPLFNSDIVSSGSPSAPQFPAPGATGKVPELDVEDVEL
jgi:Zn-dependent protease